MDVKDIAKIREYLDSVLKNVEDTIYEIEDSDRANTLLTQVDDLTRNFKSKSAHKLKSEIKNSLKDRLKVIFATLPNGYTIDVTELTETLGQNATYSTSSRIAQCLSYNRDELGVTRVGTGTWILDKQGSLFEGGEFEARYGRFRDEIITEAEKLLEQKGRIMSYEVSQQITKKYREVAEDETDFEIRRGKYREYHSSGLGAAVFTKYVRQVLQQYAETNQLMTAKGQNSLTIFKQKKN